MDIIILLIFIVLLDYWSNFIVCILQNSFRYYWPVLQKGYDLKKSVKIKSLTNYHQSSIKEFGTHLDKEKENNIKIYKKNRMYLHINILFIHL